MSTVVYELTEVFSASTGKLRHYGIMRVTQQIARELVRRKAAVRYGFFSYAHKGFLEVFPRVSQMASRMEGWGLPAGEALWCGTPAICSTAPVLREVCGDLGLYFDPDAPNELAAHMHRLMQDAPFAADLRDRVSSARPNLRNWGLSQAIWKDFKPESDSACRGASLVRGGCLRIAATG